MSLTLSSTLASRRILTILACPAKTAQCSAVRPVRSTAFVGTFGRTRSRRTTSARPFAHAQCSAVRPSLLVAPMFALRSSSSRVVETLPYAAADMSGVQPYLSLASTMSLPLARSYRCLMLSASPSSPATWSDVRPLASAVLGSTPRCRYSVMRARWLRPAHSRSLAPYRVEFAFRSCTIARASSTLYSSLAKAGTCASLESHASSTASVMAKLSPVAFTTLSSSPRGTTRTTSGPASSSAPAASPVSAAASTVCSTLNCKRAASSASVWSAVSGTTGSASARMVPESSWMMCLGCQGTASTPPSAAIVASPGILMPGGSAAQLP
mmetsp:Transcript_9205/g.26887  ORF Transcript_9205/g.26887 Transcript_9205/m.26887 type:complete len:325 (+) Transcript_9205:3150-4124(+)